MILFPTPREAYLPFLICSLILGVLLGAFYELFRIRRRLFYGSGALSVLVTVAEDVIFFTVAAVSMILVCYKLSYGVPRWYAYGAAALGIVIWRKTAGRLVFPLTDGLKRAVEPVIRRLKAANDRCKRKLRLKAAIRYTRRAERLMLDGIFKDEK